MKNLTIVILLVLLVGLGIYVLKKEGIDSVDKLTASIEKTVDKTVESVKSKVDSGLQTGTDNVPAAMVGLPGDTVFSLVFPGKAIAPAITHLSEFVVKVKTSSLGKKLEIDKMIDQGLEAAKAGSASTQQPDFGGEFGSTAEDYPGADMPKSENGSLPASGSQPSLEEVLKAIQNFDKLEVLMRAKTLEGKATPLLKVNASFKDDNYSNQLQAALDGFVEMSKQGPGPELKKDEKDPSTYVLNIKPPMAPVEVLARVRTGGKDINATIGLIAGPAKSANTQESAADSIIAQSSVSKDSFASYINVKNINGLLDVVASFAPGETEKQQVEAARTALNSSLGIYNALAFSSVFQNGLSGRSCSRFTSDQKSFDTFKSAIESAKDRQSVFYKLIGPRTTFAARADTSFIAPAIKLMTRAFGTADLSQGGSNPELADAGALISEQLKTAEEQLSKLKLKDIGFLANAPTTSFIPDVGIYIEHEKGTGIEQFGAILQELFKKLAPPSLAETSPITVSKDASGQTQVLIPAMEGYQLTFRSISPTQIFGSIQDTFTDEAKNMLSAKDSYLDDSKLSEKGVKLQISKNDNFYFLSTSSLMPLVRQFAPFLTMSKPELKISDSELTQFLDLFDFNLLMTGENTSPENLVLCSSGQAVVY